jgi:uncharacterized membrane protein YhaH (DUF805 family)
MDWKNLFLTYEGRLNRQPFWIGNLVLTVFNIVGALLGAAIGGAIGNLIGLIFALAVIYPGICIAIKRYHDRDKSGWWICIIFIPIIGIIWYIVELGFLRGTEGENRFGPDPLAG